MKKSLLPLLASTLLAACTAPMGMKGAQLDYYPSANEDSRVLFLVLHYTEESWDDSLRLLARDRAAGGGTVSAHYLVRDDPVKVYQLVDENRRAWQAGASYWQGTQNLNSASIGIEIVNPGDKNLATGVRNGQYAPYPAMQLDAVVALVKDIVARHHIKPDRVVGHEDIAPDRRRDPGPFFPWHRLYEAGVIAWPDAAQVGTKTAEFATALPSVEWAQTKLGKYGYLIPVTGKLDEHTRNVISAFQMKYRPAKYDGELDAETAALIDVATTPGGMRMADGKALN
ncbi:MAG: N-acetylmuramoyl-L-alanine amidase [Paucibacter sp.]|nr:N-acetylmuramoyl-L-alanine amidase [Roseateles sp.]